MSGIEAIGILASVAQLVHYTAQILDYIAKIKDTLQRAQQYTHQIRQLLDTAQVIERSPSLQKDIVHSHIKSTLSPAQVLFEILDQIAAESDQGTLKRLWRTVRTSSREREILALFDKLEKEKTALILCIVATNADILYEIQGSVQLIHEAIPGMSRQPTHMGSYNATGGSRLPSRPDNGSLESRSVGIDARDSRPPDGQPQQSGVLVRQDGNPERSQQPEARNPSSPGGDESSRRSGSSQDTSSTARGSQVRNIYDRNHTSGAGRQFNGDLSLAGTMTSGPGNYYTGNISADQGQQFNGNTNDPNFAQIFFGRT